MSSQWPEIVLKVSLSGTTHLKIAARSRAAALKNKPQMAVNVSVGGSIAEKMRDMIWHQSRMISNILVSTPYLLL
jgi:hypothetical protein